MKKAQNKTTKTTKTAKATRTPKGGLVVALPQNDLALAPGLSLAAEITIDEMVAIKVSEHEAKIRQQLQAVRERSAALIESSKAMKDLAKDMTNKLFNKELEALQSLGVEVSTLRVLELGDREAQRDLMHEMGPYGYFVLGSLYRQYGRQDGSNGNDVSLCGTIQIKKPLSAEILGVQKGLEAANQELNDLEKQERELNDQLRSVASIERKAKAELAMWKLQKSGMADLGEQLKKL